MPEAGLFSQLKRFVVGKPIPSHLAHHERLSRTTGLAVLSSDALSSVAYATEEILRVLVLVGTAALGYASPIAFIIAAILAVVVFSYRQTIHAYPSGGGAYLVSKDNLGEMPALIAAASLLIDYVLTVAVSIAAGVAAVTSAFPQWHVSRVELTLGFVVILMLGNLRGIRESGRIFAIPTYFFIVTTLLLIGVGAWRASVGGIHPIATIQPVSSTGETLTLFLLLTAFANGCTAMTGVEAVSNGVPAFRPPESRNAAATMLMMAAMSITMFIGITLLAQAYHVIPSEQETVISQLARGVFGARGPAYYAVQAATMLILVLAANTAYADFPRLASILARDRYVPRQFMNQGDRLAFSNGIVGLSIFAGILLIVFNGDTHALIPLYMIGVFVSFTLSQAGMVVHWWRLRGPGWRTSATINGVGALVTGVVLVVVAATKAHEGAWVIMLLIPVNVLLFRMTRTHYDGVAAQLTLRDWQSSGPRHNTVLVPISGLQRAVVEAVDYARTLSADVRAVYVNVDPDATEQLKKSWDRYGEGVPLAVLESPYRSLMEPLLEYIEQVHARHPGDYVTVVLPEFVPAKWWHHLFHNQRALLIKGALLFQPHTVVTSVPFHFAALNQTETEDRERMGRAQVVRSAKRAGCECRHPCRDRGISLVAPAHEPHDRRTHLPADRSSDRDRIQVARRRRHLRDRGCVPELFLHAAVWHVHHRGPAELGGAVRLRGGERRRQFALVGASGSGGRAGAVSRGAEDRRARPSERRVEIDTPGVDQP